MPLQECSQLLKQKETNPQDGNIKKTPKNWNKFSFFSSLQFLHISHSTIPKTCYFNFFLISRLRALYFFLNQPSPVIISFPFHLSLQGSSPQAGSANILNTFCATIFPMCQQVQCFQGLFALGLLLLDKLSFCSRLNSDLFPQQIGFHLGSSPGEFKLHPLPHPTPLPHTGRARRDRRKRQTTPGGKWQV